MKRIAIAGNSNLVTLAAKLKSTHSVDLVEEFKLQAFLDGLSKQDQKCLYDSILIVVQGEELIHPLGNESKFVELIRLIEKAVERQGSCSFIVTGLTLRYRNNGVGRGVEGSESTRSLMKARWTVECLEMQERFANLRFISAAEEISNAETLSRDAYWFAGRIFYSDRYNEWILSQIEEDSKLKELERKKVLAIDLDDTLWGGVVGEEGPNGIALSEEPDGKPYRDFQRVVRHLKEAGVLLVIISKNELGDVREAFKENKLMILQEDDFVFISCDWREKAERLVEIAEEIGLTADSFVFVDNSPYEREMMRKSLPDVEVPDFPQKSEDITRWAMEQLVQRYFAVASVTEADVGRTRSYVQRAKRAKHVEQEGIDCGARELLGASISVSKSTHKETTRIHQLVQRTNQFNVNPVRYTLDELTKMIESDEYELFSGYYEDRFGSEGLVAVGIANIKEGMIENIMCSCRVIGRGLEEKLLQATVQSISDRGWGEVKAKFTKTRKNGMCSRFYSANGFTMKDESPEAVTWNKTLSQ